ncbi:MAG: hypothetical protein FJ317_03690 [SAR202 cluster bacterium]|nr:hypothetical protein [SAR202 cluster bacterium]
MPPFTVDYLILVFFSALAAIQIAATYGKLTGILFIKHALATRVLGFALIVGMFAWFFISEPRNINDYEGGLDANLQAILFACGGLAAVAATFALSSLVNRTMRRGDPSPDEGFDALTKTTFYAALRHNLGHWRIHWRTRMKQYFSG